MITRAPIIERIEIESVPWVRWFTDVSDTLGAPNKDSGTFAPSFSNLTTVGTVVESGNFVRKGDLLFFDVVIDPAPASTSASTLGTTFFTLPNLLVKGGADVTITASGYGTVNGFNVETATDFGNGFVDISSLKAFTPAWTATGDKISITGWVRIEGL